MKCRVRFATSYSDRLYLPTEIGACRFLSVQNAFEMEYSLVRGLIARTGAAILSDP